MYVYPYKLKYEYKYVYILEEKQWERLKHAPTKSHKYLHTYTKMHTLTYVHRDIGIYKHT